MHYEWEHAVTAGTSQAGKTIDVTKCTGDKICQNENFRPDIVKIDVEGHEVKVLKGLVRTIHDNAPVICLEFHPDRILEEGDSPAYLETYFGEMGYSARFVGGEQFSLSSFRTLKSNQRLLLGRQVPAAEN